MNQNASLLHLPESIITLIIGTWYLVLGTVCLVLGTWNVWYSRSINDMNYYLKCMLLMLKHVALK